MSKETMTKEGLLLKEVEGLLADEKCPTNISEEKVADLCVRFKKEWGERKFEEHAKVPYSDDYLKWVVKGYCLAYNNPSQLELIVDARSDGSNNTNFNLKVADSAKKGEVLNLQKNVLGIAKHLAPSYKEWAAANSSMDIWRNPCNKVENSQQDIANKTLIEALHTKYAIDSYFIFAGFYFLMEDAWEACPIATSQEVLAYTGNNDFVSLVLDIKPNMVRDFCKQVGETYVHEMKHLAGTVLVNADGSLNTNTVGRVNSYTLYKGKIANNVEVAYVQCYCPSTDRMFMLGCDIKVKNAKDAVASLCMIPKGTEEHLIGLSRQGEKFVFKFTPPIMEKMEKGEISWDISNLVPMSGDKYFGLMNYEY